MIYALIAIAGAWGYHRRATAAGSSRWPAWASAAVATGAAIGADLAARFLGEVLFGPAFTSNTIVAFITGSTAAYTVGTPIQILVSERLIPEPPFDWSLPSRDWPDEYRNRRTK